MAARPAPMLAEPDLPTVAVVGPDGSVPARKIDSSQMRVLAMTLQSRFSRYVSDRQLVELRWLKNLRQYLGIYDPSIESQLGDNTSRAYPRLTRVKCVSMLSRLMKLMFPGNDKNWELKASPSAEMDPESVKQAVFALMQRRQADGLDTTVTEELIMSAVQELADTQAAAMSRVIDDQLTELGENQTPDWIALNRMVCGSGIRYGLGVLRGPFVREIKVSGWAVDGAGTFQPTTRTIYKPQFEFLSVWDFYPDMSAKSLPGDDGYFVRLVMGQTGFRALADRPDFFGDEIKRVITTYPSGNYTPRSFESELKSMGIAQSTASPSGRENRDKFEIVVWHGPVAAAELTACGVDVPDKLKADTVEAEIWLCGSDVIKADINPWRRMGVNVKTVHCFVFDEDDTSPVGSGLPQIVRDSQLSLCAVTRMALDNASVTCGASLEINRSLMAPGQDFTSHTAYKNYYRDDDNPLSAQYPAVREIKIDSHLPELQAMARQFMEFAEMETFVGPMTGGDMTRMPSEPMRTAGGGAMLRNDAALPFQDVVRHYDGFTQSVIQSTVMFNKKFNPTLVPPGDYCAIARGATSLIAKEVKGMQIDQLAQTLKPEDLDHIDERRFIEERLISRDMGHLLVPPHIAKHRKEVRAQQEAEQADMQQKMAKATERVTLSDAFKNMTQGQKNVAAADANTVSTALDMLEKDLGASNDTTEGASAPTKRAAA